MLLVAIEPSCGGVPSPSCSVPLVTVVEPV